ncbi:aminodeoxychorismate/anthranilate synthase component II [Thalassotalea euphylliae]|uniref:Aminodeoxychorismate/anthranilate synthase component II n=1 Tax=Thalassotalea euphylliae TaxID=1655234 RepID=A0A3E0TLI5_9GAMM|nr:aminodeoxychorismate/anthranilate synthase component II [Thalassotalea euphylliae]REL25414.1 aminodeoxychorismate/anthranilate synthase component II [Thalassotalea euphylliae]
MLLMIDNYDSFTFNLVHYFQSLGQIVKVARNDEISLDEIAELAPEYLVISPGPCDPDKAGISLSAIAEFAGKIPILGVCLGHQSIAQHFGAKVERAKQVMHGKTSYIRHTGTGLFDGLNQPLEVTRYHSLIVNRDSLPDCLKVTAWTTTNSTLSDEADSGKADSSDDEFEEIMALEHQSLPIASVQFHPESVLTEQGHILLNNFLAKYQQHS